MKFHDLKPEQVQTWVDREETRLFLEWLIDRSHGARDESMAFSRDGNQNAATIRVGRWDAYNDVIGEIKARAKE